MNLNVPDRSDKRTVAELLAIIQESSEDIQKGLTALQM